MGNKIFVSYKYGDDDVYHINGYSWEKNTVRNYVDDLENKIDNSDHIYKAESDGDDLSGLSEEQIWETLKNRIYDSTLTIIMISKNMKTKWKDDKDQWIPREISYSLKEISRINASGISVASKSNALLGIVIPDKNNSMDYFMYNKTCCPTNCRIQLTDTLFGIMKNNTFNIKEPNNYNCDTDLLIFNGDCSYISIVEWDDFINDTNKYINKAYKIQDQIDNYNIFKEV